MDYKIELKENITVSDSNSTEARDFGALIYSCDAAAREYELFKTTKDEKHLFVVLVMTAVAVEAFFNNIVEFYQPKKYKQIVKGKYSAVDKIFLSVKALTSDFSASDIPEWTELQKFIAIRNKLVHNKVKSRIVKDGNVIQAGTRNINWQDAEMLTLATYKFLFSLHTRLRWDSDLLEGGKMKSENSKIRERFDEFFSHFRKLKT